MFQLLTALQDVLAEEQQLAERQISFGRLEEKVRQIQSGDEDLRNQVITDCLPYIKGVLHRMLPIAVIEQADEFSVALTAFNEALDRYRYETHVPFLRFAGLVINRRTIDWLRQQRRHRQVLTFSQCEQDNGEAFIESIGSTSPNRIWENMEIEEDLVHLRQRLQAFNLSLAQLIRVFPRHRDSRLTCIQAARQLLAQPILRQRFEHEHRLPAADLARLTGIALKTIERNRQSIIFLSLLLSSDLDVLKAYLTLYSKEV